MTDAQLRNTREYSCYEALVVLVLSVASRLALAEGFIAPTSCVGIDDGSIYGCGHGLVDALLAERDRKRRE